MRRVTFVGRIFFTMVTFGAALLLVGCPQEQGMDPELWGTWEGDPVGSPVTEAPISVQFGEDGEWSMTQDYEEALEAVTFGGSYIAEPTGTSPHKIDMHIDYFEAGDEREPEHGFLLGLYSIDGDELTLAVNVADSGYPPDIESAAMIYDSLERTEGKDSESTFQIRPRREEAE